MEGMISRKGQRKEGSKEDKGRKEGTQERRKEREGGVGAKATGYIIRYGQQWCCGAAEVAARRPQW
jgi:hypothetical protein